MEAKVLMAFSFFSGLLTNGIWSFQVDRIPIFTGWPTAAMFNRLRHQQLLPMELAEAELASKRPQLAKYLTGHPYRIEFLARAETRMTWSRPPWWWGPSIAKMSTRPSRAWPPTQTWLRLPEPLLFCKWTVSSLWWTRHNAVRSADLNYIIQHIQHDQRLPPCFLNRSIISFVIIHMCPWFGMRLCKLILYQSSIAKTKSSRSQ